MKIGWLVGCVLRPIAARSFRDPHLLSFAKDMKLGKYTVPIGNRTPGRLVAVHYSTAVSRKLCHNDSMTFYDLSKASTNSDFNLFFKVIQGKLCSKMDLS